MKQLSFLFLIPFFLFFSITEKDNFQFEETTQKNQSCRLEKIFLNDTSLYHQYHYNDGNKLKQIDIYSENKLQNIFSLDYDNSDRISVVEYSYVIHRGDRFFETYDVERLDYFIYQKNKYTYLYSKKKPTLIKTRKSYSGRSDIETIAESDLSFRSKYKCVYNSENQLIKFKKITKYRGKKKVNKKINAGWYEFDYDNNNNLNKISRVFENEHKDTIVAHRTERTYDSSPSLQFNYADFMHFPGVFQYNNITHEKYESLGKNAKVNHEFKFTHEYNKEGLISKTTREVIHHLHKKYEGKVDVYTYKYACE